MEQAGACLRSPYVRRGAVAAGSFLGGVLCARGLVFGRYAPFGVAMAAAAPRGGMWAAVLGAMLGYIAPSPVYVPLRYAAALLAVAAIRWSLSELPGVNSHPLFAPAAAFLPLLLTGMTMVFLNGSMAYSAALYVAESFLAAGCGYFLQRTASLLLGPQGDGAQRGGRGLLHPAPGGGRRGGSHRHRRDPGAVLLPAHLLGGLPGADRPGAHGAVLRQAGGASAAGRCPGWPPGVILGLSTAGLSYLSGAYGLGGLMAGVFAPMGKLAAALAFIVSHGVASLQVGSGDTRVLTGAIEVAAATLLYMALPSSRRLTELFGFRKDTLSGSALRGNIILRLRYAAQALTNVYDSVEEISQKLSQVCAPTMQGVYDRSVETVCAGCGVSTLCWRKKKEATLENFSQLTPALQEKGQVENEDFTEEFSKRCGRLGELRDEINKNYARYQMKESAELQAAEIRQVVEAHFKTHRRDLGRDGRGVRPLPAV